HLDLRPPHAAMTETHAVDIQRFGNDDVVDTRPREVPAFRQPGNAAEPASLFVHRARNLDRAGKRHTFVEDRLNSDHGGGEAAFHVASPATVKPTVLDDAGERIDRPILTRFNDIDMAVEMDAGSGAAAFDPGHDISARMAHRIP